MEIANLPSGGNLATSAKVDAKVAKAADNIVEPKAGELKSIVSDSVKLLVDSAPQMSFVEREETARISSEGGYQAKNAARGIVDEYKDALKEIKKTEPDLLNKDWDIAVNSEDELIIKTGGAGISASEAKLLTDLFDKASIKEGLKGIQDGVVKMSEADYRYRRNTGSAEHYDLDRDSAAVVISARDILDGLANNGPGREFNFHDTIRKNLSENGDAYLKPETKNLRFIEVEV
ncbi:hypothetical protein [Bacterioplanoides sp.]|uniref:hypothetical protein n=1 Tax=Bacterioplanoides sp. TaxID=2066072 RepID=UPI003B5C6A7A